MTKIVGDACRRDGATICMTKARLDTEETEVTPEMIEAGVGAFWSFDARFEDAEDVVRRIWCGMNAARVGEPTVA